MLSSLLFPINYISQKNNSIFYRKRFNFFKSRKYSIGKRVSIKLLVNEQLSNYKLLMNMSVDICR